MYGNWEKFGQDSSIIELFLERGHGVGREGAVAPSRDFPLPHRERMVHISIDPKLIDLFCQFPCICPKPEFA